MKVTLNSMPTEKLVALDKKIYTLSLLMPLVADPQVVAANQPH